MRKEPLRFAEVEKIYAARNRMELANEVLSVLAEERELGYKCNSGGWVGFYFNTLEKVMIEAGKAYLEKWRIDLLKELNDDLGF